MTDQPPSTAPAVAPAFPRPSLEMNLVAVGGVVAIALADIAAVAFFGLGAGVVSMISTPPLTGLFAIINRSPAP